MSNKEYFLQRFSERAANCNDDKGHSHNKACRKRVDGPEDEFIKSEGYVDHKLAKEGYGANAHHGSPCNIKIAASYVFAKGDNGYHKDTDSTCNGEGKRHKPIAAAHKTNI